MTAARLANAGVALALTLTTFIALLVACAGDEGAPSGEVDAGAAAPAIVKPVTCVGPWQCSGPTTVVPTPTNAGCELRGFVPPLVLTDDWILLEGERVVGHAYGGGDSIELKLDGGDRTCRGGANQATRACEPHCGR